MSDVFLTGNAVGGGVRVHLFGTGLEYDQEHHGFSHWLSFLKGKRGTK